jgi:hypothetical protein
MKKNQNDDLEGIYDGFNIRNKKFDERLKYKELLMIL